MNSPSENEKPGYQKYNDFWVRLVISFLAAIFITRFGQSNSFLLMFFLPAHQIALVASTIISYVLFTYIYLVARIGDHKLRWKEYPIFRPFFQITFGYGGAAILAFCMAKYFYLMQDVDILKTGYMKNIFPLVAAYLAGINIYYSYAPISAEITKLLMKNEKFAQDVHAEDKIEKNIIEKNINEDLLQYLRENDIIVIERQSWTCMARTSLNKEVNWPYNTVSASMEVLPPDQFIRGRGNMIIRADAIESIKEVGGQFIITLKDLPEISIPMPRRKEKDFIEFGEKYNAHWWNRELQEFR